MHEQLFVLKNHIFQMRSRCDAKSPTAKDMVWPIPGFISCARVMHTLHDGSTTTCELVYCNLCGGFTTDTKCALQQAQCWLRTGGSITDRYLTHIAFILMVQCCMMSGGSTHNVHTQITAYECPPQVQICLHHRAWCVHHHTRVHTEPDN